MQGVIYLFFGVLFILVYKYVVKNIGVNLMGKIRKEFIQDFKITERRVKYILENQKDKVYYECSLKNLYFIIEKEGDGYKATNPSNGKYANVSEKLVDFICDTVKHGVADAYSIEAFYTLKSVGYYYRAL